MRKTLIGSTVASLALLCAAPVFASQNTAFENTPISNIIAQVDKDYGVTIVLKDGIDGTRPVTVELTGARSAAQAVNAIAAAVHGDYQKMFVVSQLRAGESVPAVKLDTNPRVSFRDTTLPAREAMQSIASADAAAIEIHGSFDMPVTLSDRSLRARDAAAQVARQTHSRWKTFYSLTAGSGAALAYSSVIDHTNGGQPILKLPFTTPAPRKVTTDMVPNTVSSTTTTPTPSGPTSIVPPAISESPAGNIGITGTTTNLPPNGSPNFTSVPNAGNSPYGYGTNGGYGYNPYGSPYGGYGYGAYGGNGYNPYGGYSYPAGGFGGYPGMGQGFSTGGYGYSNGYGGSDYPAYGGYGSPFGGYGAPYGGVFGNGTITFGSGGVTFGGGYPGQTLVFGGN